MQVGDDLQAALSSGSAPGVMQEHAGLMETRVIVEMKTHAIRRHTRYLLADMILSERDHAETGVGAAQAGGKRARSHLNHMTLRAVDRVGKGVMYVAGQDHIDMSRSAALQRLSSAFCLDRNLRVRRLA